MSKIGDFFKGIGSGFSRKRYEGIIEGGLPAARGAWSQGDFLNANDISLYVNRAIAKRAEKVGEIEFILRNPKGEIIENPTPEQTKLLNLLYRPNPLFTGRQFWALVQKYLDFTGEAYIYIERKRELFEGTQVTGFHVLKSDLVEPKQGEDGLITSFEYKTPNKTITYDAKDILYLFTPDPKMPMRGQSLLKAGVAAIQTEVEISSYHARVLKNGGKVEGVFKFKTPSLTKEQLDKAKAQYKQEYAGAKKAGLPLFMGGDGEYQNIGLSPSELSYLEAKKMTLEDICIMTGVPKSVLGSMDDVQYSNADTGYRIFLRETIRPLLRTLTTALDEVVFPQDVELDFVDPTPENIEEKLKVIESGVKNYYMTINEARERSGLEPIADGDRILVPFTLTDLSTMDEEPAPAADGEGAKGARRKSAHPLADYEVRRTYEKIAVKRADQREKRFKRILKEYLEGQEKRIIEALQPTKTRVFRKKDLLDEILQVGIEVKIGRDLFLPVLTDLLKDAGIDAMELAGSEGAFDITADISGWLDQRAGIFLNQVNETTYKELKGQFEQSFAASESRDQLVNRIVDTYQNITKERAVTIARTEVHNATQYGTMEGYKQAGLTTKIWVAVGDAYTRDSHLAVDGEERPMNTPFSNGLMFPGDPKGPPEEIINCRCVI